MGASGLAVDQATIRRILEGLQASIDELSMRQRDLLEVGGQAFGASPGGSRTHRHANRAYEVVLDTLVSLRSAHTEFSESLHQLEAQLASTDLEAEAMATRLLARVDGVDIGMTS